MKELLPVIAGFLLTTILGGTFGFVLQRRSWNHQHDVQLSEQERERAVRVFEEVSRLFDRRLYRLRLLHQSVQSGAKDGSNAELTGSRLDVYREVLFDWNDSINRNLALIQQYFGNSMRDRFDYEIGSQFVQLGREVEARWKSRTEPDLEVDQGTTGRGIDSLAAIIYAYNVDMLHAIQRGEVGRSVTEGRGQGKP